MSRGLHILGTGLVLTAVVLTLNSWDTVVDPDARRHAFDEIRPGMSRDRVESLVGSQCQFRSFSVGSIRPGTGVPNPPDITQECRWEDAHETVDIEFRNSEVTKITRLPKNPPDTESLWWGRLGLALLAIFGLVFLLEGLTTRSNLRSAKAVSSPPAPPA